MNPTERHLTVRGSTLHVVDAGGPGEPIVLAHGVGSSARFLVDAFARPLAGAGLRLVAFDLRGHGSSAPARSPAQHRLEEHAADLEALAGSVGARAIGGVSLGAHAAVAAGIGGGSTTVLACLPAWTGRALPGEGTHAAVARSVVEHGVAAMVAGFARDATLEPWLRTVLVRDWAAADARSLVAALGALDGGVAPSVDDLGSLPAALAVVGWPDDPCHPLEVAEAWATWAPRASIETLSIGALDADLEALGRAAVRALGRLGAVSRAS